jgi:hypothetical protein
MGVEHDRAVLDITVLLEQTRNVGFGQARVDTGDKQVGAAIKGTFLILFLLQVRLAQRARATITSEWTRTRIEKKQWMMDIPVITVIGAAVGGAAASAVTSRLIARRGAAVAVVPGLICRSRLDRERAKSMKALTGVAAVIVVVISHDGQEAKRLMGKEGRGREISE